MQDGDVQLWGVQSGGLLDTLPGGAGDDEVTAVEPIQAAPYVLLGLRSGSVKVAALLGERGSAEGGACEACSMQMLPHESAYALMHALMFCSCMALACVAIVRMRCSLCRLPVLACVLGYFEYILRAAKETPTA